MDARQEQAQELRRQIEWTLARAVDPSDVLPMLHRLARLAHDGSDDSLFANLHLAELARRARPVASGALRAPRSRRTAPEDDRGWATLALCQTLLGNYKFAVSAYHHALTSAPKNPWYAHNLGHLLDVALGRAAEAIGWLKRAYQSAPDSGEVAASYAHALARVGRLAEARKVLTRAMKRGSSREHAALAAVARAGRPGRQGPPAAPSRAGPRIAPADSARRRRRRRERRRGSLDRQARRGHAQLAAVPLRGPEPRRARRGARARALEPSPRRQAACSREGVWREIAVGIILAPSGAPRADGRRGRSTPSPPPSPTRSSTSTTSR